jgi:hypothetical protein
MDLSDKNYTCTQAFQDLQPRMNELEERECTMISGMNPPTKQDTLKKHEGIQLELADLTQRLHRTADSVSDASQPEYLDVAGVGEQDDVDSRSETLSSEESECGGWATPQTASTTRESAWVTPNESFTVDSTSSQDTQSDEWMLESRNLDEQLKAKIITLISRLKRSD